MKLYYSPGACSLASHIVLREVGAAFDLDQVDLKEKRTASGDDYLSLNPKGYVPALDVDGETLTEGAAILQFLADRHPDAGLAPAGGTVERARVNAELNYVGSELHKSFSPLFNPAITPENRAAALAAVEKRLDFIESRLADGRPYLTGDRFTVADAYLFAVARWSKGVGVDLSGRPNLAAFQERVAGRETVRSAMQAEGLLEAA